MTNNYPWAIALTATLTSCQPVPKEMEAEAGGFNRNFPLKTPVENALLTKWANKEVKASLLIDDMEEKMEWKKTGGIATIDYTEENVKEGKRALRYHTIKSQII